MQQTAPRRGRPRSPETIARDEAIHQLLAEGSRSRGQLAEQTGLTTDLVTLALGRLRRADRIRQCLHNGVIVWSVADGTPCP
jgi:hypothetical protein